MRRPVDSILKSGDSRAYDRLTYEMRGGSLILSPGPNIEPRSEHHLKSSPMLATSTEKDYLSQ